MNRFVPNAKFENLAIQKGQQDAPTSRKHQLLIQRRKLLHFYIQHNGAENGASSFGPAFSATPTSGESLQGQTKYYEHL
jgi:hypothetical protein